MSKSLQVSGLPLSERIQLWPHSGAQLAAENQFRSKQPLHAYLLVGAKGIGKRTFAKHLCACLYCEAAAKPCLQCPACKQVFSAAYPQVLTLFADDGKTIGVDKIRELLTKLSRYSLQDGMRVVMIEPMEKLTPAAQNALLKQLEEPAENIVFLLMTHDMSATLGTIASRCVRIPIASRTDAEIRSALLALGCDSAAVDKVLPRCSGNIGMALEAVAWSTRQDEAAEMVRLAMNATRDADVAKLSTRIKENREVFDEFLLLLEQQLAHMLFSAVTDADTRSLSDYPLSWRNAVKNKDISQINALLRAVFTTRSQKESAVNPQCSIDQLLIQLVEAQNKWQKLSV